MNVFFSSLTARNAGASAYYVVNVTVYTTMKYVAIARSGEGSNGTIDAFDTAIGNSSSDGSSKVTVCDSV